MAIVDNSGNWVVKYTYDPWGNILTTTASNNTMYNTLAQYNPLRYRGYVYDRETGLYYLQSRYYDSESGRFINADTFQSTGQGVIGSNMFSYCGNDPVNKLDQSGYFFASALIGAAINVATSFVAAKVTGQEYTWTDAAVAAGSGFVNAIPVVGPIISGAVSGIYTGITSYNNGASLGGAICCGVGSALATTCSISNLANFQGPALDLATTAVTDVVFGTAYNSMSAAVTKTIVDNTNRNVVAKVRITSALAVARNASKISNTRIVDGKMVPISPRARYMDTDGSKVFCYVQF